MSVPTVSENQQATYLVYFEMSLAIFPTSLELGDKSYIYGLFGLFVISEDAGS